MTLMPALFACVLVLCWCRLQEAEDWLQLLLELVSVVGSAQLLEHVLPFALAHGEVNEPVVCRVVCCRLLGAMTPYLVGVLVLHGCAGTTCNTGLGAAAWREAAAVLAACWRA